MGDNRTDREIVEGARLMEIIRAVHLIDSTLEMLKKPPSSHRFDDMQCAVIAAAIEATKEQPQ